MDESRVVQLAREIAARAHDGQVDKAGHAYIEHPERVAARVSALFPEASPLVLAVALLHDVLEDTPTTASDLIAQGVPAPVVTAVEAVTKRDHEPAEDYFRRVRSSPWGRMVKQADIDDNTDPTRVAQLDPATAHRLATKYARARTLLASA